MDIATGLINVSLLGMLFVVAVAIIRMRNLFAIVMLSGVYSLISATWFVVMDAVDVAFTEAAVGAGISTALMLGAMLLTSRRAKAERNILSFAPLLVCLVTGAVLIYATIDLPALGDATSPANSYVGAQYLANAYEDAGVVNVVTVVLASYRGIRLVKRVLFLWPLLQWRCF
jgi:multicomponent Na+:H+ antiporter subunit B